jgi:hypothetical protein
MNTLLININQLRISLVLVALMSAPAFAWDTISGFAKVTSIQVGVSGFSFSLEGNPAMCGYGSATTKNRGAVMVGTWTDVAHNGNGSQGSVTMTAEDVKNLLASITAAYLSGKTIRVYASESNGSGWGCRVGAIDF